jgi:hypothetical protein
VISRLNFRKIVRATTGVKADLDLNFCLFFQFIASQWPSAAPAALSASGGDENRLVGFQKSRVNSVVWKELGKKLRDRLNPHWSVNWLAAACYE